MQDQRRAGKRLVGRSREMRELQDFFADEASAVIVVEGPRGIGKSLLVEMALSRAAVDSVVLRFTRHLGDTPYGSLIGAFSTGQHPWQMAIGAPVTALLQGFADGKQSPGAGTGRELDKVVTTTRESMPRVLVLEDLHLTDSESLEMVLQALHQIPNYGFCVVVTVDSPLPGLRASSHRVMQLQGLELVPVRQLVADRFGPDVPLHVIESVHQATAGNPSAMLGVLTDLTTAQRSGVEPLPFPLPAGGEAMRLMADRVSELDGDARLLLALFAHHQQVPDRVLCDIVGTEPVRALHRLGLLVPHQGWRLRDPSNGLVAWAGLGPLERTELAHRASEAWRPVDPAEALNHSAGAYDPIGYEAQRPADPGPTIARLRRRGEGGRARRLADAYLRAGIATVHVQTELAELELESGHVGRAQRIAERALRHAPTSALTARLRYILVDAAMLSHVALPTFVEDSPVEGGALDSDRVARLNLHVAQCLVQRGSEDEAHELVAAAVSSSLDRPSKAAAKIISYELAATDGPIDPKNYGRAVQEWLASGELNDWLMLRSVTNVLLALGQERLGAQVLRAARSPRADISDHRLGRTELLSATIRFNLEGHRFGEANRDLELLRQIDPTAWKSRPALVGARLRISAVLSTQAPVIAPVHVSDNHDLTLATDLAQARLVSGDAAGVLALLRPVIRSRRLLPQGQAVVCADYVESLVILGRTAAAATAYERCDHRAQSLGTRARHATARMAVLTAGAAELSGEFKNAMDLIDSDGTEFEHARLLIAGARRYQQTGDLSVATALLDDAQLVLTALGLTGWHAHTEGMRARLDQLPVHRWPELTGIEREYVAKMINGMTINKIAASVGLSRRTILSRMQTIYSKVGVNGQAELLESVRSDDWAEDRSATAPVSI